MKYYKFEKLKKGANPIIRVTYKNWFGKLIVKDICQSSGKQWWIFMENDRLVNNETPINNFYKN